MNMEERLTMYNEKKTFVDGISEVFRKNTKGSSVTEIKYEVYQKEIEDRICFREWVIVHYVGGGKCACTVSGNNNSGIFTVIGKFLNGGYYEEAESYKALFEQGWVQVI